MDELPGFPDDLSHLELAIKKVTAAEAQTGISPEDQAFIHAILSAVESGAHGLIVSWDKDGGLKYLLMNANMNTGLDILINVLQSFRNRMVEDS